MSPGPGTDAGAVLLEGDVRAVAAPPAEPPVIEALMGVRALRREGWLQASCALGAEVGRVLIWHLWLLSPPQVGGRQGVAAGMGVPAQDTQPLDFWGSRGSLRPSGAPLCRAHIR